MDTPKQHALRFLESLREDCTFEDIAYHFYVCAKIERGIRDIDEGRLVSHEEVGRQIEEWAKAPKGKRR